MHLHEQIAILPQFVFNKRLNGKNQIVQNHSQRRTLKTHYSMRTYKDNTVPKNENFLAILHLCYSMVYSISLEKLKNK